MSGAEILVPGSFGPSAREAEADLCVEVVPAAALFMQQVLESAAGALHDVAEVEHYCGSSSVIAILRYMASSSSMVPANFRFRSTLPDNSDLSLYFSGAAPRRRNIISPSE